jgi:hypothetical protein
MTNRSLFGKARFIPEHGFRMDTANSPSCQVEATWQEWTNLTGYVGCVKKILSCAKVGALLSTESSDSGAIRGTFRHRRLSLEDDLGIEKSLSRNRIFPLVKKSYIKEHTCQRPFSKNPPGGAMSNSISASSTSSELTPKELLDKGHDGMAPTKCENQTLG